MSSINSVRKLQILYFSKKNKEIKKLKKKKKSAPIPPVIHTTNDDADRIITITFSLNKQ